MNRGFLFSSAKLEVSQSGAFKPIFSRPVQLCLNAMRQGCILFILRR